MVLLGDGAQVEARFGPLGGSANLDARLVHGLRRTYHSVAKLFWTPSMVLLDDEAQVEACLNPFLR